MDECKTLPPGALGEAVAGLAANLSLPKVGRCRLPVSKPVLKPPLVSALEAKM